MHISPKAERRSEIYVTEFVSSTLKKKKKTQLCMIKLKFRFNTIWFKL